MQAENTTGESDNYPDKWESFRFLTKAELQLIDENRYEANFKKGEIIIKQGSPASSVLFLSSGLAKSYFEGLNGKNLIMDVLLPGRLIMGPGAYFNSRYAFSVAALTPLQACFIDYDVFKQLIRVNGEFAESLIEDVGSRIYHTNIRMVNLVQKKMHGRLAEILIYFADTVFGADDFEMILSRQELGEMTGMVKENVVRILGEFEKKGIITVKSSAITILDKEELRQISEK